MALRKAITVRVYHVGMTKYVCENERTIALSFLFADSAKKTTEIKMMA